MIKATLVFLTLSLLIACSPMKQEHLSITVQGVDLNKYQGRWYEIARFPHTFEKGLENVFAEYALRDDGKISVYNYGYHKEKQKVSEIRGYAWVENKNYSGALKVRFFWPFAAPYLIADIDLQHYQWVLVTSPSRKYNWILCRETSLDSSVVKNILQKAHEIGIDTTRFEYVKHDPNYGK
jgi:apolipoprotein D and lipocalin family protein